MRSLITLFHSIRCLSHIRRVIHESDSRRHNLPTAHRPVGDGFGERSLFLQRLSINDLLWITRLAMSLW